MSAPSDALKLALAPLDDFLPKGSKRGWRNNARQRKWYQTVYHLSPTDHGAMDEFRQWTRVIFRRDRHSCQGCFIGHSKLRRMGRHLTCHHITPRADGGELLDANLITLCNVCH